MGAVSENDWPYFVLELGERKGALRTTGPLDS